MSRWLLVGEGTSEIGDDSRPGFLQVLLRQLAGETSIEVKRQTCAGLVHGRPLPAPQPKGMARTVARAERAARVLQCDAVVVLVDRDGRREREEQLRGGGAKLTVPHALGLATEMLEAWLLADPELLEGSGVKVRKRPEELLGKEADPASQHPKVIFARVLRALGIDRDQALERWEVARAAERAPHLEDFRRQLEALLSDPTAYSGASGRGPTPPRDH